MINLLPPNVKSGYSYARRNVALRGWVVLFLVALIGLAGITTFGLATIQKETSKYERDIAKTEALFKKEKYDETQKQVKDIGNSFKLVAQVLGNEVLFSKLIQQIAVTIPPRASLSGLTINQSQSAIDISASVADYATATQMQVNLSDPNNKIFSKADIVSVSCGSANPTSTAPATQGQYPCTVGIRALFAAENPYLFVNSKGLKK